MENNKAVYGIKCRDKYVYYYGEDYMYGEISLVETDVDYEGLFFQERKFAEFRLKYIKDKFSLIVNYSDIDIFDVLEMEIVEVR